MDEQDRQEIEELLRKQESVGFRMPYYLTEEPQFNIAKALDICGLGSFMRGAHIFQGESFDLCLTTTQVIKIILSPMVQTAINYPELRAVTDLGIIVLPDIVTCYISCLLARLWAIKHSPKL